MTTAISRDAEIVLSCLFMMGRPTKLQFARPNIIHPRTKAALEELTNAGLIDTMPAKELPKGSAGWQGNNNTLAACQGIKRPSKDESFPITTE